MIGAPEAYLVTSLLEGVINSGTAASARAAGVPGAVAGKTGTTNDGPRRLVRRLLVEPARPGLGGLRRRTPAGLSGAEGALPIWSEFMRQALDIYPGGAFPEPAGITHAKVDVTTGRRATAFCPLVVTEVFLAGTRAAALRGARGRRHGADRALVGQGPGLVQEVASRGRLS